MIPTLAEVCTQALGLPAAPVLIPRILHVLSREDSSVAEFESVVKLDTALAVSTLRLANSAYFSAGHNRVDNLGDAIQRLGQREIYRLAALALTGRWMNTPVKGFGWEASDFCRFSLVTAVAAEYLAEQTGRVEPQTAYTAGLLHEVGKLAVAYSCANHFGEIRERQESQGITWLEAEKSVLGYNHAEVGAMLLRRWNFPEVLIAVAQYNPPTASAPAAALPLLVHVHAAKFLATSMGPGVGDDGFLFNLNAPLLSEWGITNALLESALPVIFDRASRIMKEKLTYGQLSF
ncbi:HDOD domain-containing protein [Rariglobus hedericola]|uniref:HDOD domain-containing protein n=1 Tax=Rariglobus hedericola TaxID=2597822 RepID=A0A556QPU5_9BACT|nr:HDOD domain-containing protein [Rariglobus hedericola]TSJ78666.1 HDOD domain-containing protein [Rariglobus hedericola]